MTLWKYFLQSLQASNKGRETSTNNCSPVRNQNYSKYSKTQFHPSLTEIKVNAEISWTYRQRRPIRRGRAALEFCGGWKCRSCRASCGLRGVVLVRSMITTTRRTDKCKTCLRGRLDVGGEHHKKLQPFLTCGSERPSLNNLLPRSSGSPLHRPLDLGSPLC